MADTDNLRTASLYINNQLLSRGLLRDGSTIDFADPLSGGDLGDTMSRIMGVVNDLILRRDRDAEHREALSQTLRTLRAENLRQTNDLQRECDAHADAQRRLQTAEAANQTQRLQLSQAESMIHKLKDEAVRTKALVAQTRGACANEVRKRDRQIDSLKKAVLDAGRARGERRGTTVTSITVTGEMVAGGGVQDDAGLEPCATTACIDYDLGQESNAFLAELAKGLSGDNEALLALVRRLESNLKDMSGYEGAPVMASQHAQAAALLPGAVEELEMELEAVLQHLRTILTNPCFVPIEEVVVRDEEIHRLREGWEKMETRWKEAVHLIDGWRRRMASSGKSVNMEELKMGLRLSPVRIRHIAETSQGLGLRVAPIDFNLRSVQEEEEDNEEQQLEVKAKAPKSPSPAESLLHLVPAPGYEGLADDDDDDTDSSELSIFEDDIDIHDLDVSEPNVQILEQSMIMESLDSSPLPEPPQLSPLKDSVTAGNRRRPEPSRSRKRPGEFSAILEEENAYDSASAVEEAPPPKPRARAAANKAEPRQRQTAAAPRPVPPEVPSRPNSAASYASTTSTTTEQSIKLVNNKPDVSAPSKSGKKAASQPPPAKKRNTAKTAEQPSTSRPARLMASRATTRPTTRAAAATRAVTTNREAKTHVPSKSLPDQPAQEATSAQPKRGAGQKEMPPPPVPPTRGTRQPAPTPGSKLAIVLPPISSSRLPLPRTANANGVPQSPLTMATIQAKLAASERDADAARVRAKLKAARLGRGLGATAASSRTTSNSTTKSATDDSEQGGVSIGSFESTEPVKKGGRSPLSELTVSGSSEDKGSSSTASTVRVVEKVQELSPRKRGRRAEKVASRRRSTLNAWELKTLISGEAAVSPTRGELTNV